LTDVNGDVRCAFLVSVALLGVANGGQAASAPPPALVALTGGELGSGSRLVGLEPRILRPAARSLALPGWAFGYEWARSPEGDRIALVPKPSETNERLFVIGTRGSLTVFARMRLPGEDVCRLAWPSPRRLLLVLTRGPACYTVIKSARVVVIDPVRGRVVARRPLSGEAVVIAAARTRDGLALLLAPAAGRSGARLVVVSEAATRTIALPLHVSARSLDKSVLGGAIGLAVNREAGHAYLVEPAGRVLDVNLASSKVSVFEPPLRKPAAAAKGPVQSTVQALWLGRGVLAVTGVRRMASGRLLPLGLWLTDTRSWRSRLVDPMVTGMAYSGTTVLAFQPFFDQLGAGTIAIGLRGYSLGGLLRFRAFAGKPITVARVQGRYAYVAGLESSGTSVVDVSRGRVEPPDPDAISISPSELLAGPGL
jgi:hypothetical protein